jgi:O-acetyl-ADP-ribose deacetylase (regulator of RNase III)
LKIDMKKMQYLFIDKNARMVEAWRNCFVEEAVTIMQGDITAVTAIDAIVSPANSFGFMDGGLDLLISHRLGWNLQTDLQRRIQELPEGELLVGRAMVIETGDNLIPFLISAPTMRIPMSFNIHTSPNAYLAMKAALIAAKAHPQIQSVAIPGFCTGIGKMMPEIAALQMHAAFREIEHGEKMKFDNYAEASKHHWKLNPQGKVFE